MTPDFIAAVLDTLLPGDDVLPSATRAGLDPASYVAAHHTVFDAVAAQADGAEVFLLAGEDARADALRTVERRVPEAFRALLTSVLSDYCEATAVLTALGWDVDPPQPTGHTVPSVDESTATRLGRVRRRGKLWRD